MRLKTDWASLLLGRKLTAFLCFTLYLTDISKYKSRGGGAYIWSGDLKEGFLRYEYGKLIFGGAYTWRGLFSEFYGIYVNTNFSLPQFVKFRQIFPQLIS